MSPLVRSYVTLRSFIRWLLPAMSAVAVWPLVWLGLQGSGGGVYLVYFLMVIVLSSVIFRAESRLRAKVKHGELLKRSTQALQFLTLLFFYLFSYRCLVSLVSFGDSRPGSLLSHGLILGGHTLSYGVFLSTFRKRRVLESFSLIVWLLLVVLASALMIYNFQLPVFAEAFQSFAYPSFQNFRVLDLLWIYGLALFSLGVGWGLHQGPTRAHPLRDYHFGLWVFFWSLVVGLLTVPYVFKLNFATSSFETLLSHLPMVFPHLPAGHFAGKSLLLIFYLGSFMVSLLILTRGVDTWWNHPQRASAKILAVMFLITCAIGLSGVNLWLDTYFKILIGIIYPLYSLLGARHKSISPS